MMNDKELLVLAFESSCDDTSVAVVRNSKVASERILSNIVISQSVHEKYNGVVPEQAARSHIDNISQATSIAIEQAGINIQDVNCIASTRGPGLIGGLLVGCVFAKTLCTIFNKPFFGANHLEGHALSPRLCYDIAFPYFVILVSGGNSMYIRVDAIGQYHIIGQTIDDALGEAFDKIAVMLGLPYPGGVWIDKLSKLGDPHRFAFTMPLQRRRGCDLSFSGIKTAAKTHIQKLIERQGTLSETDIQDMAASFQHHAIRFVIHQFNKAHKASPDVKNVVIGGGVASNTSLREQLQLYAEQHELNFYAPTKELCTDNAAMIAWSCIENISNNKSEFHNIDIKCDPKLKL